MHFEETTDLNYNKTKCIGIWRGSNKGNPRKLVGFKQNSDATNVLGYTKDNNAIQAREQNWEKMRKII